MSAQQQINYQDPKPYYFGKASWLLFQGIVGVILGVLMLLNFRASFEFTVNLLSIYFVASGVLLLAQAFSVHNQLRRILLAVSGLLAFALTIWMFASPDLTARTVYYIMAIWAGALGVFEMWSSIHYRKSVQPPIWMTFSGWLSIIYAVFYGIILLIGIEWSLPRFIFSIGSYTLIVGSLLALTPYQSSDQQEFRPAQAH